MVLTDQGVGTIAGQAEKVVVGTQDGTVGIELDHRHGPLQRLGQALVGVQLGLQPSDGLLVVRIEHGRTRWPGER